MNDSYIFPCPHCNLLVEVRKDQVNCSIFRHGYFFEIISGIINLTSQMNPHTPKDICDKLVKDGKIYGCGKPFKLLIENGNCKCEICDYI